MIPTSRIASATSVVLLCAAGVSVLAGCSSDEDATAAASASGSTAAPATPSPPTLAEQQITWAGQVCISRQRLEESVTSLGSNLAFDLGADASVLDQLERQLRMQVLRVGSAASDLSAVLVTVPLDPLQANSWIEDVTGAQQELQTNIDETTARLDAVGAAQGVVDGLSEGAAALSAGAAAFDSGRRLLDVTQQASAEAQEELAPAFAAAPECQSTS